MTQRDTAPTEVMTPERTRRRDSIFRYVSRHLMTKGYAPTIREIQEEVGIASSSNVLYHLQSLANSGLLMRDRNKARGLTLGDAAGVNVTLSIACHSATRWAATEVGTHLHELCPGRVFQAWDGREFDCECACGHGSV